MRDDKQPTLNEAEPQRSKIEQDGSTEKPTNEYVLVSWSTAEPREHFIFAQSLYFFLYFFIECCLYIFLGFYVSAVYIFSGGA
jgi:hypothetical protein